MLPTRSLSFAASSESGSIFLLLLSVRARPLLRPRAPFKPPNLAAPFCAEPDDSPLTYRWSLEGRLAPLLALPEPLLPAVPLPGCLAARDLYGRGLLGAGEPFLGFLLELVEVLFAASPSALLLAPLLCLILARLAPKDDRNRVMACYRPLNACKRACWVLYQSSSSRHITVPISQAGACSWTA